MNTAIVKKGGEATNRRWEAPDIEEMSMYVAKGLTESEAARLMGREPRSWFVFKCRGKNDKRFGEQLEAARAKRINDNLGLIEKSAKGEGMKQRDWRAADRLLQIADSRFRDDVQATPQNTTVNVFGIGGEELRKLAAKVFSEQKQLPEPKKELVEST